MTAHFERFFPKIAAVWLVAYGYKALRFKIFDNDLWWHLASGRVMVENKIFLRSDIFSHTVAGMPWVNFEWLSQILLYLAVKFAGLSAILYGKVVMGFVVLAVLAFVIDRLGVKGSVHFWMVFTGFMVLKPRLYERIELVTLTLLPFFVFLLAAARQFPAERLKKIPWILFGLLILWCNLHAGFIYGIGAAVLFSIGARWSGESPDYCRMLDRTLVLLLVALCINPFGVKITDVFIEHLAQLFAGPQLIQEWAPLSVEANPFFWILFFVAGWALSIGFVRKSSQAKFWTPVVVVFLIWGTRYSRNAATTALIVLPFLADFFRTQKMDQKIRQALWVGAIVLMAYLTPRILKSAPAGLLQENLFPIGACQFVQAQNIRGTMYNTYHMGGYIEWALGMDRKIFMDGRYIFQPLLVEHARLDGALFKNPRAEDWQIFLNRYGVDYAIVDYGSFTIPSKGKTPFSLSSVNFMFPRSDWALVYWDDAALVFLKRTASRAPLIGKFEYRALWPYNLEQMGVLLNTKMVSRSDAESELSRQRAEVSVSFRRSQLENLMRGVVSKNP